MATTKTFVNIRNKHDRIIALVDMDAFYTQVEEKLDPSLRGKPIAVVQYNAWKGGGIIAVNYVARARGVGRHMRGDEAKELCPDIVLCRVPQVREKADLSKYREAGADVASVLQQFTTLVERASIDEAYLDITDIVVKRLKEMNDGKYILLPNKLAGTYAVGYNNIGAYVQEVSKNMKSSSDSDSDENIATSKSNIKLMLAAAVVNEIRAEVLLKTNYTCSAGIAHNKILAKLTCGMNKPNKQTILPLNSIPFLYDTLPIGKVKGLGGKFGENVCESLKIKTMSELLPFSEKELQKKFEEKMGTFLYNMARGIDLECVQPRYNAKSIGCSKKFPGQNAITGISTLTHWLGQLSAEIVERLEKDNVENMRTARLMTVTFTQQIGNKEVASTRSVPLAQYNAEKIASDSLEAIKKSTDKFFKGDSGTLNNPIKLLGIGASKFEDEGTKSNTLQNMLNNHAVKTKVASEVMSGSTKEKMASFVPKKQVQLSSFFNKKKDETPLVESTSEQKLPLIIQENEVNEQNNLIEEDQVQKAVNLDTSIPINGQENYEDANLLDENEEKASESSFQSEKNEESYKTQEGGYQSSCSDIFDENDDEVNEELPVNKPIAESEINEPEYRENENDINPSDASDGSKHEEVEPDEILNIDDNPDKTLQPSTSAASNVQPCTSKSIRDYTKTYAEFQQPSANIIPTLLDYTMCPECQKDVPSYQLPEHLDNHFAFQLSHQLREEYRSEHKIDLKTRFALNAKPKLKSKESKLPSVAKFLTKIGILKESNEEDEANKSKCNECGKMILNEALEEHKDYHFAKNLLKSESVIPNDNKAENKVASNKRKSGDSSKDSNPKSKLLKTYFSKNP